MFIHCDVSIIPEMESKTIDGREFVGKRKGS